jgi:hypothetical protein
MKLFYDGENKEIFFTIFAMAKIEKFLKAANGDVTLQVNRLKLFHQK